MYEEVDKLAAYIGLIVNHFGGEIVLTEQEIIEGLPDRHGIRITIRENNDVAFTLEEIK